VQFEARIHDEPARPANLPGFLEDRVVSDSSVSGNNNSGITVSSAGTSVVLGIDNGKIAGNTVGLLAGGSDMAALLSLPLSGNKLPRIVPRSVGTAPSFHNRLPSFDSPAVLISHLETDSTSGPDRPTLAQSPAGLKPGVSG
jgi:hypothetical protein